MVARKYVEVMSHMIPFHIGYGTGRSSVWVEVSDNCIVSAADFQLTSTLYTFYLFLIAAIHIGGRCLGWTAWQTKVVADHVKSQDRLESRYLSLCLQYPSSCPWCPWCWAPKCPGSVLLLQDSIANLLGIVHFLWHPSEQWLSLGSIIGSVWSWWDRRNWLKIKT